MKPESRRRVDEDEAARRLSREARAFPPAIFLAFAKDHPALGERLHGKDPAIWDFFVAIAAMGLACLGADPARRKPLTKALHAALSERHPDTGRALLDFIRVAEKSPSRADAAGAWVVANVTPGTASAAARAAASPLGRLLERKFSAWAA